MSDSKPPENTPRPSIPTHALSSLPSVTDVERLDLLRLTETLLDIELNSSTRAEAIDGLTRLLHRLTNACAVVFFERDADGQLIPSAKVLSHVAPDAFQQFLAALQLCAESSCRAGTTYVKTMDAQKHLTAVTVPVTTSRDGEERVLACIFALDQGAVEPFLLIVQLVAASIELWEKAPSFATHQERARLLAESAWLTERLVRTIGLKEAASKVADGLTTRWSCRTILIGMRGRAGSRCRLTAVSGASDIDESTELAETAEAVFDEASLRDDVWVSPESRRGASTETVALQRLLRLTGAASAVILPLRDAADETIGAWIVLGDARFIDEPAIVERVESAARIVGPALAQQRLLQQASLGRALAGIQKTWKGRKAYIAAAAVALTVLVMCIPMPMKVACECVLAPVARRFVAAPFDTKLEKVEVKGGDFVRQGETLATLDGQEIRWELAGLTADRNRAAKMRAAGLANHDIAAAQMAALEMERYDVRRTLLREREQRLAIDSPIDGIVLSEGLERREGVPLKRGQVLFEIAPSGEAVAELAIPDEMIRYVRAGQEVRIRLHSRPSLELQGVLARIAPRSETRDGVNVFLGEVRLTDPGLDLRPGMDGRAKIIGDKRPIFWNLFHGAIDYITYQLGT